MNKKIRFLRITLFCPLQPHLKIQKKSKLNKSPVVPKPAKEIKPPRKRRTRKPAATSSPKQSPQVKYFYTIK